MRYEINVVAQPYWIQEPDPEDRWDSGQEGLNIFGAEIEATESEGGWEVDSAGGAAVVLVEHYSDGDTFGSGEYAEVKGLFPTEEAARLHAGSIRTDHGYFGTHIGFLYFGVTLPKGI